MSFLEAVGVDIRGEKGAEGKVYLHLDLDHPHLRSVISGDLKPWGGWRSLLVVAVRIGGQLSYLSLGFDQVEPYRTKDGGYARVRLSWHTGPELGDEAKRSGRIVSHIEVHPHDDDWFEELLGQAKVSL
mgnify:CR=1 FL=1